MFADSTPTDLLSGLPPEAANGILPFHHVQTWFELGQEAVYYQHASHRAKRPMERKKLRRRARHALDQAKWELMLVSVFAHLAPAKIQAMHRLQASLETLMQY